MCIFLERNTIHGSVELLVISENSLDNMKRAAEMKCVVESKKRHLHR